MRGIHTAFWKPPFYAVCARNTHNNVVYFVCNKNASSHKRCTIKAANRTYCITPDIESTSGNEKKTTPPTRESHRTTMTTQITHSEQSTRKKNPSLDKWTSAAAKKRVHESNARGGKREKCRATCNHDAEVHTKWFEGVCVCVLFAVKYHMHF